MEVDATTAPVLADGRLHYTLTVSNVSLVTRNNVRLLLWIPDEVRFAASPDADPDTNCGTICSGREASWNFASLAPGESRTITINARVNATVPAGTLLDLPVVVTADGVLDPVSQVHTVRVTSTQTAELVLGALAEPVQAGESYTVTVDVGNLSTGLLDAAELRLRVPSGVTVGAISDGGTEDTVNGEVVWNLGTVNVSSGVHREVVLTAPTDAPAGRILAMRAELRHGGGAEPTAVAEHAVTVSGTAPPLVLAVATTPVSPTAGGSLTYTFTITNVGAMSINNVRLLYTVPDEVRFGAVADADPDTNCGAVCTGRLATWEFVSLAPGASEIISVNAIVDSAVISGELIVSHLKLSADGVVDNVALIHVVHVQ